MQKVTKETLHTLLNETIEYYSNNPRAVDQKGNCRYLTPKGNMCAVGRCLLNPEKTEKVFFNQNVYAISRLNNRLKPQYRGVPLTFWGSLQKLHDNQSYWEDQTLSEMGQNYVDTIKKNIDIGIYKV